MLPAQEVVESLYIVPFKYYLEGNLHTYSFLLTIIVPTGMVTFARCNSLVNQSRYEPIVNDRAAILQMLSPFFSLLDCIVDLGWRLISK